MAQLGRIRAAGMPSAVIPGRAAFASSPESIRTMVVMDFGPVLSGASRN